MSTDQCVPIVLTGIPSTSNGQPNRAAALAQSKQILAVQHPNCHLDDDEVHVECSPLSNGSFACAIYSGSQVAPLVIPFSTYAPQ